MQLLHLLLLGAACQASQMQQGNPANCPMFGTVDFERSLAGARSDALDS
jgi:hypothetical protein